MNKSKSFKYRLLRRVPGPIGRRYARKLDVLAARTDGFAAAVRRSEGMTCIDLGANVGRYTRTMSAAASEVIAFEPDPWAYAALLNNLSDLDNVVVENAAAGVSDGVVTLYRTARFQRDPARYSQSSSVVAGKNNISTNVGIEVRQIDFVRYLQDLDRDIGILKIDIEGAEVDLLEKMFDRPEVLERIGWIFAETHERRIPDHRLRVAALRDRAARIERPFIDLDWN